MASNGEEVRKAALSELARRELARRAQSATSKPTAAQQFGRFAGSGARMVAEGAMDIVSPWADVAALGLNAALPGKPFPERHSQAFSQNLTQLGLPEPQGGPEQVANIAGRMVTGAALGGAVDKAVMGGLGMARPPPAGAPPSAQQLKDLSRQAYEQAEKAGVVISPQSFSSRVGDITATATKEGLNHVLHPQATAALKELTDAASSGQPIPLQQLETLRKIAKGAAESLSKDERRISRIIVDALDDYALNLQTADVVAGNASGAGQLLINARNLWSRASKGEVVNDLVQRAEDSAKQFSGSGFENAIRTEFRSLIKNPRRMRVFSPVEQQALRRVARGGPVENILRYFGKLAPTGAVSGAISGGVGAAVGGVPGAIGLPLAAGASRQAATALTSRNARLAGELMRRGGPAISQSLSQRVAPGVPYALGATPTMNAWLAQLLAEQEKK